ncbi:MAG: glycoside hydrolase family 3 C-terminal domain-containing protein [Treponema sp.]|jgi:beta-glucosidase|nr:glycoside hydrolase family 3 C-terminal domain-containing protein [Treponema sp.]
MEYQQKIKEILSKMTLEEKSELCMGKNQWQTQDFPHLGIPSVMMTDGTNGVRFNKTEEEIKKEYGPDVSPSFFDVTTLSQNSERIDLIYPATCFPSGSAIASSWDRDLIRNIAAAVAAECKGRGLSLLLGPAMNIRRSPMGGRSFEYFSEDPVLSGEIAAAYVEGLQANGVGACLKHYTCNNSETLRTKTDSVVEERALREIFLAGFERALKAKPASVMSSYNLLNGVQMAENKRLLTDILREEWGFDGFVVSDWHAIKDRVQAALAGNDLEMPYNSFNSHVLSDAVRAGTLGVEKLDEMCTNILSFVFQYHEKIVPDFKVDFQANHKIAQRALEGSMVLLKNEGGLLPLDPRKEQKVLVTGSIAKNMRYQGGGCALVNPTALDQGWDEMLKKAGKIHLDYAPGYYDDDSTSACLLTEAAEKAKDCSAVVVFAGLAVSTDIEGADRKNLDIEKSHAALIEAVSAVNDKVIVVLANGAEVVMPWIDKVRAVLEIFMCGEAGGSAVAGLLFGEVNPSGKLTVTFPKRIEDLAAFPEFPGENARNIYTEGIYVGYRYFDVKKIEPLFPFGHGLSYTNFEYSGLKLSAASIDEDCGLDVSFTIKNTGNFDGAETAQLYIVPPACRLRRPPKELKGFEKVFIKKGEGKTITLKLEGRDFMYYDPEFSSWVADAGTYEILIGKSSADIVLKGLVQMTSVKERHVKIKSDTVHTELFRDKKAEKLYFDWLIEQGIIDKADDGFKERLAQSFVGLYNTLNTHAKRFVSKEEFQDFLDKLNAQLGR